MKAKKSLDEAAESLDEEIKEESKECKDSSVSITVDQIDTSANAVKIEKTVEKKESAPE